MFDSLINWLKGVLETVLTWIKDFFVWLGNAIYSSLMDGLASALESIPQPDFVGHASSYFAQIPTGVVYFFSFFAIPEGFAMIITALVARFLLRRIPFIG